MTCQHSVPITCLARQVAKADFTSFTHILASDENNLRELMRKKPSNSTADIRLWGAYLDNKSIPDPYYGAKVGDGVLLTTINPNHTHQDGFEAVFRQCTRLSNAFLDEVFGQETQRGQDSQG